MMNYDERSRVIYKMESRKTKKVKPFDDSDNELHKGSDSYEKSITQPKVFKTVYQHPLTWQWFTVILFVLGFVCITSITIGLLASPFILRPINCECGHNCIKKNDIHGKLEKIMKYVREEKNVSLQPDRNGCGSGKTLPRLRWLPRQVLADVKKLNLIRHVLRKEQIRVALEYAETKKKRMGYARKMMLKEGQATDSSNGMICENPSNPLYQYDCVYGNKGLHIDGTDVFDVSLQLELMNEVYNEGDLLFELGLVYENDINQRKQIPGITGYRCKQRSGVCLELFGRDSNELFKNEVNSKLVESHFSFKLHQKNIMFIKDDILQSIFKIESDKRNVFLYPAGVLYNPHLAKISLSIPADTNTIFNITSIDNHIFASDDNKTISNLPISSRKLLSNIIKYAYVLVIIIVLTLFFLTVKDITWRSFDDRGNITISVLVLIAAILAMCEYFIIGFYVYTSFHWYVNLGIVIAFVGFTFYIKPENVSNWVDLVIIFFNFLPIPCIFMHTLYHFITYCMNHASYNRTCFSYEEIKLKDKIVR